MNDDLGHRKVAGVGKLFTEFQEKKICIILLSPTQSPWALRETSQPAGDKAEEWFFAEYKKK